MDLISNVKGIENRLAGYNTSNEKKQQSLKNTREHSLKDANPESTAHSPEENDSQLGHIIDTSA